MFLATPLVYTHVSVGINFRGWKISWLQVNHENNENWHPTKITSHTVVRSSLTERQQHPHTNIQPILSPEITNTPTSEFRTEGCISCAFPTLFPTGAGDFSQPRLHTVTIGNYFKHLMMYKDGSIISSRT